jgi:hypothetical protein
LTDGRSKARRLLNSVFFRIHLFHGDVWRDVSSQLNGGGGCRAHNFGVAAQESQSNRSHIQRL